MRTTLLAAAESYFKSKLLSRGTRNEYRSKLRKWSNWNQDVPIQLLQRKHIREFLDWVYERTVSDEGTNPGRMANKAREHVRAILSWAWEQELIDVPPRFPHPHQQRDVAGRHYLTKSELNALYFATHQMRRPRGWDELWPVGQYWRAALVLFSTTASILERFGSRRLPMSRFCGDMFRGVTNHPTGTRKKHPGGAGCTIDG